MSENPGLRLVQSSRRVITSWTAQCPHCQYLLFCDLPTWEQHGDSWTDGLRCGYSRSDGFPHLWICGSCGNLFLNGTGKMTEPKNLDPNDLGVVIEPSWDEILDFLGSEHSDLPLGTRQGLAATALWLANQPLRAVLETGQFRLCDQHLEFGREYKWLLMLILEVFREDSCPHGRLLQAEVYRYLRCFDKAENLLDQRDFGSLTPLAQSIWKGIQDQSQLLMRLETSLFWAGEQ
jgi:hypothetical protein